MSIRDKLIEKCYSQRLRRKLLENDNPNLDACRQTAIALEASELQASALEHPSMTNSEQVTVNPVVSNVKWAHRQKKCCYACGYEGHIKSDDKCPAWGKSVGNVSVKDTLKNAVNLSGKSREILRKEG